MMGLGLTKRELDARNFIAGYIKEKGYSPSYDEISAGIGLRSKSGVTRLVNGLEQRGHIARVGGSARSIVIVDPNNPAPTAAPISANAILDTLPGGVADRFRRICAKQGDKVEHVLRDLIVLYVDEIDKRGKRQ